VSATTPQLPGLVIPDGHCHSMKQEAALLI
jgi:hypothetical protein